MANGKLERDEILDPSIPQAVIDLDNLIQGLTESFTNLQTAAKNLDFKVSGGSGISDLAAGVKNVNDNASALQGKSKVITDLSLAVDQYNKILTQTAIVEAKQAVATSDEVKAFYQKQAVLAETTKALKAEAAASTEAARAAAAKKQADIEQVNASKAQAAQAAAAAKAQKDQEIATRVLQKAQEKLNAEKEKAEAKAAKEANAYEILKKEYNEAAYATKTLAAEYVIAQREGSKTTEELGQMSAALKQQQKDTLAQSNALLQMEQAVGQSQRAVGNYANATGEISQILRELPNFAISAQTGILSLSNNLPLLRASLVRLSQTVDVNTGKAIGWSGVLKTVGSSLLSWESILVLGITLAISFGDKIGDIVNQTTNAEKAQNNYSDALKASTKEVSGEIGELTRLQAVLNSTSASRVEQTSAILELQDKYPNFFANLKTEEILHANINERIQEQIDLLNRRAEDKASQDAITKATEELSAAQLKLNENIGPWEKFWAARPWGAKPYDELTQGAKAAIDEQYKLYQLGVISKDQYNVMYRRLQDVADAQDLVNKSVQNSLNPQQDKINKTDEEIKQKTILLKTLEDEVKQRGSISVFQEIEIRNLKTTIQGLEDLRKGYIGAADARDKLDTRKEAPLVTNEDIDVQEWERRVSIAKKGSAELVTAEKGLAQAKYAQTVAELDKELEAYKDNSQKTLYYAHQKAQAQIDLNKALKKADEDAAKPSKFDSTNVELEAQQRVFVAQQSLEKQQLESTNAYLSTVFEDETQSLDKRLAAYEQYVLNLQAIQDNQYKTDSKERTDALAKIAEIEKRTGLVLTESNHKQINESLKLTAQEKTLYYQKEALMQEDLSASLNHADANTEIQDKAQKKETEIIKNSIAYQVKLQTEAYRDLADQAKGQTAVALAELEKQRDAGTISEKNFWTTRQNIVSSESALLYQKEIDFLTKRKDEVIALLANPEITAADKKQLDELKNNLDKAFGDLVNQKPGAKRTQGRSILSYLGLEPSQDNKDLDDAKTAMDNAGDVLNNAIQSSGDEINTAREEAAAKFGEGTKEYNDYIAKAQATSTTALEQASAVFDAATDTYTEKTKVSAEKAKEAVAKAIDELAKSLENAYNNIGTNKYKEKIDALDAESEAIKKNLDEQLAANEASSLSDKEKADKEAKLKATAQSQQDRIDAQKKTAERDEAIRQKRNALFQAVLNGEIAIGKIIATYAANPILEGVLIALTAAQVAANVASISSTPIPAYWQGTPAEGHPGGLARVSDRGLGAELAILPSGRMFMTPDVETVMKLPKGTHIIPHEKLAAATERMNAKELAGLNSTAEYTTQILLGSMIERAMARTSKDITKAIEDKQELHFNWHNGELQKAIKNGANRTKWIGGLV